MASTSFGPHLLTLARRDAPRRPSGPPTSSPFGESWNVTLTDNVPRSLRRGPDRSTFGVPVLPHAARRLGRRGTASGGALPFDPAVLKRVLLFAWHGGWSDEAGTRSFSANQTCPGRSRNTANDGIHTSRALGPGAGGPCWHLMKGTPFGLPGRGNRDDEHAASDRSRPVPRPRDPCATMTKRMAAGASLDDFLAAPTPTGLRNGRAPDAVRTAGPNAGFHAPAHLESKSTRTIRRVNVEAGPRRPRGRSSEHYRRRSGLEARRARLGTLRPVHRLSGRRRPRGRLWPADLDGRAPSPFSCNLFGRPVAFEVPGALAARLPGGELVRDPPRRGRGPDGARPLGGRSGFSRHALMPPGGVWYPTAS